MYDPFQCKKTFKYNKFLKKCENGIRLGRKEWDYVKCSYSYNFFNLMRNKWLYVEEIFDT